MEIRTLGRRGGPLYNVAYPKPDRWSSFVPGEVENYVADSEHMPAGLEGVLIHRYPEKALFLVTQACLGHCQFCFRPDIAGHVDDSRDHADNLSADTLDEVCAYLHAHPRIREIILSGGDPLTCRVNRLDYALQRLTSVPSIRGCRLHTRAPVYAPECLSGDVADLLDKYRIRIVFHAVHPYELTDDAAAAITRLKRRGIMMYNQFPLLNGINDHPAVIMELGYRCNELGIHMLSMFIADPIKYGATYRLRLQRVFDIADEIFFHCEGWLSNIRVCQDTPKGKVKREHITSYDEAKDQYVFVRQGHSIVYRDIPRAFDQPTPLSTLLYAGARHVDISEWPETYNGIAQNR